MKLGLGLGFLRSDSTREATDLVLEAERLGFDSVWTAEAYGSDALTPLAWLGSRTTRVRLGTAVMQIPARTPAATGMAALTLDFLSGGRFVLGLGVSGPQVAEGWYGQRFAHPLARTREYVRIVRDVVARNGPVTSAGPHYPLPLPDGTGLGKPLQSILHPHREDISIFLGAEGPRNMALAGEIADGLLTGNYLRHHESPYRDSLNVGFTKPGARQTPKTFEVGASVYVICDEDVERAADVVRPRLAFTIGGMGAPTHNFHANVLARAGYEAVVEEVRHLYEEQRIEEAAAAIPLAMVEEVALVGPKDKIKAEIPEWEESLVTTMILRSATLDHLHLMADLFS